MQIPVSVFKKWCYVDRTVINHVFDRFNKMGQDVVCPEFNLLEKRIYDLAILPYGKLFSLSVVIGGM